MLSLLLIAFPTLFAIVDPLACIGPFLAMTDGQHQRDRTKIALKAVTIATGILFVCAFGGNAVFKFFGITLPALKLAGGLLLFVVAFQMLHAQKSRSRETPQESAEAAVREDVATFPLAIPLLAGPGSIISVFILMEKAHDLEQVAAVYLSIVAVMASAFVILYFAQHLGKYLGAIGINLLTRTMGLVLAAISVQFIIDAIRQAFL
jgi:multiple antibiotic resistance protein